jgi:hypothetical protein
MVLKRALTLALVVAAGLIGSSGAYACISCNYTPEVLGGGAKPSQPKQYKKAPVREPAVRSAPKREVQREAPRAKKREVVRTEPRQKRDLRETAPDQPKSDTATVGPPAETTPEPKAAAVTAPVEAPAAAPPPQASAPVEPAKTVDDARPVASGAQALDQGGTREPDKLDCKRFSPTTGTTVSVPCE